ncbi:MAG TPA: alpha-ketoglutarate-dependent dioxygenase AlkB [Haliangiales bacterium]|nr:alpha-ketoglutarate-dependent dioxygenase AlkB [Haliangiales bacterium]
MGPDLPPGFRWIPGWLDAAEGDALFRRIVAETRWEDPILRVGGRTIAMPRRVAFFGPFAYAYSGVLHPPRPLPPAIDEIRRRIEDIAGHPFNTVLVNLYRSGADSVSWHSDDDYPHGGHPAVASLSLGATRRFRIAHKRDARARFSLELTPGGLLVMDGRSQLDYRHALPKSASAHGQRVNLTFRFMAATNAD